ncbi:hypothetical protein GLOIN_2v1480213 [Rhizophagus irregularis DAOM 181602=DAOM 197198]|uniref:Uncharacterized protein n=1 Tax=Rhizophagus irregularis (strain DAOM 181602 / DAOM 197198 / MUCL 43194) TaxID=747089 RepID=A0A2P4PUX8_RHIID|nr:hypothetical protein GLOIN_2v1480213 [Rhizophagus irregularis DAOM 181602=DAOM 197198]POG69176.1 hypothetical protein GLOIN_2v1480213 [Rhizophagus irregularis DAOM 181602=DAOM 197198]|eukprot:XP_025176042.1 hypothetical protein GLOIN_2v1480213 [Rhizophagus irregularis DAOM 181602=DAOM 197198]
MAPEKMERNEQTTKWNILWQRIEEKVGSYCCSYRGSLFGTIRKHTWSCLKGQLEKLIRLLVRQIFPNGNQMIKFDGGSVQNPECQNPEWYKIPKYWPTLLSIMLPGSGFLGF